LNRDKGSSAAVFKSATYIMIQHKKSKPDTPIEGDIKKEADILKNSFHCNLCLFPVTGYQLQETGNQ
jgi:hypothetical protein